MTLREWILIFMLGIGWGSSFFFNEILLREVGPMTVSLGRIGLGAIGCWAYVLATGRSFRFPRVLFVQFFILGLLQFAFPFSIYPLSQEYISSSAAGIINAMTPVMVVIVSHLWPGGERATVMKSLGVVLGFVGILALALPALRSGQTSEFWGLVFAVLAPLSYAMTINYIRRLKDVDPATLSAMAMTGATLVVAPVALVREGIPVITRVETWVAFGIIGFVLTSASFILVFWLLPRVGGTNVSILTYIAPVSAVLLGATVLHEQILLPQIAGMGCIFLALIVMDGRVLRRLGLFKVPPLEEP